MGKSQSQDFLSFRTKIQGKCPLMNKRISYLLRLCLPYYIKSKNQKEIIWFDRHWKWNSHSEIARDMYILQIFSALIVFCQLLPVLSHHISSITVYFVNLESFCMCSEKNSSANHLEKMNNNANNEIVLKSRRKSI